MPFAIMERESDGSVWNQLVEMRVHIYVKKIPCFGV